VKLKEYILEALDWMVEDGVAMKVDAEVERQGDPGNDRLAFSVTIYKIDGNNETYKFDDLWNNQMGIG
jgi:phage gp46-like protein